CARDPPYYDYDGFDYW
nr:immunoglobulin heavy chain junction region [Mus musculus]